MRTYLCHRKTYAVSVIIPLYNGEKYIGECLDSLLDQTFQDFEIIVVDDCSTDKSAGIVSDYSSKFDKRLTLTKTEKNLGGVAKSRNIGLSLANGEYVLFLDADDFILLTALEILYNAAKKYDADVVCEGSYYRLNKTNDISLYRDGLSRKLLKENREDKTELIVDNPKENLNRLLLIPGEGNLYSCWSKFFKRDFLLKNKIAFPNLSLAEDFVMVINVYCHAKRFLRLPMPLYFYRFYSNSATRKIQTPQEQLSHWLSEFVVFIKALHKLEVENEILSENPDYLFAAFKENFAWVSYKTAQALEQLSDKEVYKILRSKFINDSSDAVISFLFSAFKNKITSYDSYIEIIRKFKDYFTARVDVNFFPKIEQGNFQIISVSDENAVVRKSTWLPKDVSGYFIHSYAGKLEITAKASADGQIRVYLIGLNISDPKNKSKRIPYWIDYTGLTVNGKKILNKLTPAWHDKPYRYNLEVNADEEVVIQIEWLPHRGDILPPPPKEILPPPPKEEPIDKKFLPYLTARLDVNLESKEQGDFQILSVSDSKAYVGKSTWLPKNVPGYFIHSHDGKLKITAKATVDGKIRLNLLGLNVGDPKDKSKRLPYWIDYTNLTVNGEVIFDTFTAAWHDKPYRYNLNVRANEEIVIQTEWLPHRIDILPPVPKDRTIVSQKFLPHLTARVDVKLVTQTADSDFQIVSVSDNKAAVWKPDWFQKGGIGYQIQSHNGNMEIVAKTSADGQFRLTLLGIDIRNPDDKSKRIPYWIDYTGLTVNGEFIFGNPTPAWHDKPYHYNLDVKAGEEIRVRVGWLPHRSDVLLPALKEEPIDGKFLPYLTARLDVNLKMTEQGDFQILSVSDGKANVRKATWLPKDSIGYAIQSHAGKLNVVVKAIAKGKIQLYLMGLNIGDPKDKSKRIPYWIDYTNLTVNGRKIFDKVTPAWHDKPYIYNLNVNADEEIVIQAEWLPHKNDDSAVSSLPAPVATIQEDYAEIINKFKRYFSVRLDAQMITTNKADFQIISVSDKKAEIRKPEFFNKNGVGYIIQSYVGKLNIVFKIIEGGLINLNLKGLFYSDPNDKTKHIPYWVDYTKFSVNGNVIFDKLTPAWHDKPYNYKMEAKAGEEITVSVEWLPHRSDT